METMSDRVSSAAACGHTGDRSSDSDIAGAVKTRLARGSAAEARSLFDALVVRHQRRASRIAYHYLRNAADADEAVQEAFIRAFTRLSSFNEALSFEAWFTPRVDQ